MRIRLDLAYDGSAFHGWAAQPGLRTVCGVLADALATVLRLPAAPELTVAGRTDAGVHARGQVAHLDVDPDTWARLSGRADVTPESSLVQRLSGVLPGDLVVHRATTVSPDFDARFAANSRTYVYRVHDGPAPPDPLVRGWVLWHRRPLDAAAMHAAGQPLVGRHDFLGYCRPRPGASTTRTLHRLDVTRAGEHAGEGPALVRVLVEADAFCHHQVRAIVGALLEVGSGRRAEDWPAYLLQTASRTSAAPVAPAKGLVLERVDYPSPPQWRTRQEQTRARREPAAAAGLGGVA